MRNLSRDTDFIAQSREGSIGNVSFREELQSDRLIENKVGRAVNLAHAGSAEQTDDAVTTGKNRSRREPPFHSGRGCGGLFRMNCCRFACGVRKGKRAVRANLPAGADLAEAFGTRHHASRVHTRSSFYPAT